MSSSYSHPSHSFKSSSFCNFPSPRKESKIDPFLSSFSRGEGRSPGRGRGCLLPPPARACPHSSPFGAGAWLAGYRSLPGKCCSLCPELLLTCQSQNHSARGPHEAEEEFLPSKKQRLSQPGQQPVSPVTAAAQKGVGNKSQQEEGGPCPHLQ